MKQRKDGRWVKKITINGKQVFFYSAEPTEKRAEKDINTQLLSYKEKEERGLSFTEVANMWVDEYRERASEINFYKSVRSSYNRILEFFSSHEEIKKITHKDILVFMDYLVSLGFYKKTIASHKSVLNMIFQYAVIHGYVETNIVRDLSLPSNLQKKAREFPSTEEIRIVDSHYDGFDFLPYFILYSGLRRSEVLALQYEDIDFKKKTITITKHLLHYGNQPIIENRTKTENSKRTVILIDRLAEKLPKNKKGLIFCNEDGTPFSLHQYSDKWAEYQKTYGIKITAHQLRHAYATMLFEAGIDIKDAQELMGHSDINLTRQIYTHIRSERRKETTDKLNNFNF